MPDNPSTAKFSNSPPVEFIWGGAELVIRNPKASLLKYLQYYHKSLELSTKTYRREVHKEKTLLYREMEPEVVVTFHGFLDDLVRICNEESIPFTIDDRRPKMPAPVLMNAGGFRYSQKQLFFHMLGQNKSGLCQAPTRYGKTCLIANMVKVFPGVRTVVTAPGVSLLTQLERDLKQWCPDRDVRGIYTGSRNKKLSKDVTVVSMDSLEKSDPEAVQLLLVDEPHEAVSPSRLAVMGRFHNARIYGFGATVSGRFDGADKLITGTIGPVLVQKSYRDAVQEGAICPIIVYFLKLPFTPFDCSTRDSAYRALIFRNNHFNSVVQTILNVCVPIEWQTLIFIDEIKQADLMERLVSDGVVAIASRMNKDERQKNLDDMVSGRIKRCIATNIYATGMTFPELRVMFNAAGGGGSITATQKPGRLAQLLPGKKAGYVIDFLFEPIGELSTLKNKDWTYVTHDCYNRIGHYRKVGFEVRLANKPEDIVLE